MKRTALLIPLVLALAACSSSQKVVSAPVVTTPTTAPASVVPGSTAPPAAPKVAHVGDTVELPKSDDSPPAQLTLVKVLDPASPSNQYTEPDAGNRFVGVQLRIVLEGEKSSQADPSNDLTVYDSQGQSFSSSYPEIGGCPSFASNLVLTPGTPALGCVVFEVPKASAVARVQFTPASGFADTSVEWKVP